MSTSACMLGEYFSSPPVVCAPKEIKSEGPTLLLSLCNLLAKFLFKLMDVKTMSGRPADLALAHRASRLVNLGKSCVASERATESLWR